VAKKKPGFVFTSPLTREEHLPILNAVIDACNVTAAECERCEKCHIDVDSAKTTNEDLLKIALAIKAEFFPDEP
jgi:hypothetical protein